MSPDEALEQIVECLKAHGVLRALLNEVNTLRSILLLSPLDHEGDVVEGEREERQCLRDELDKQRIHLDQHRHWLIHLQERIRVLERLQKPP